MVGHKTRKIAVITNISSHYRRYLFERLDKLYDVEFLFFSDRSNPYWESKNDINIGDFRGEYLKGFWLTKKVRIVPSLIWKIIRGKYNVIIQGIGGSFPLSVSFILAKLLGIRFILWTGLWQQPKTFFHILSYPFAKLLYRYSDAILAYGEHVKQYLISLGVSKYKIFIATQAVNNSRFERIVSEDDKIKLKANLMAADKKIILFVGQLEVYKGIYYLLDAFITLCDKEIYLLFIGRGSQFENLVEFKRKRKFENILLLGYVNNEELYRYYAIADVLTLPSITTAKFKEPWGLVINEAMNQGCPVIATDAVGAVAGGLVKNGFNGLVARERDTQSLREALKKILSSEDLRKKMGMNAKETIKNWTDEKRLEGFASAINFVSRN